MGIRKRLPLGLAAVLAASLAAPPGASAQPPGPTASGPHGQARTVTLVTGDVVTVVNGRADVEPGPGREDVRFGVRTDERGHLHVTPSDTTADLRSGRLDRRLFDVTGLLDQGYGDADRDTTPLIVSYGDRPAARVAGAQGVVDLPSLNGSAFSAPKGQPLLGGLRTAGAPEKIWLDGKVSASLDRSVPQIGAPEAWQAGVTGAGVTVAVLDTGVDGGHPDLAGAVVDARDFTGTSLGDRHGHGTHVASTITGSGTYAGVAPDASIIDGKVLSDGGGGQESWIIAGMEWAGANADVVSMSLGGPTAFADEDPMSTALNDISARTGALFVVAAGNDGARGTVGSPGVADAALTVGAVDRADKLADFSSRGPRRGDNALKPDITAPGVGIVAARSRESRPDLDPGVTHVPMSGTSMATPHVSGAAALLAQKHPDWTGEQLKAAMVASAEPAAGLDPFAQGTGRVDVPKSLAQTVSTSPSSLSLGTAQWPHHDDVPLTGTLTYRNDGTAPVTLDLAADFTGPDGSPAPAGLFAVSPSQVTVAPGGTAEVTVTATTNLDAPDGDYSGVLVATGGGTTTRTAVAVTKEIESYDIDLTVTDADGAPGSEFDLVFTNLDTRSFEFFGDTDAQGAMTVRLPKGRYWLDAMVYTPSSETQGMTWFNEPGLVLDRELSLALDAPEGNLPTVAVDNPDASLGSGESYIEVQTARGTVASSWGGGGLSGFALRPTRFPLPGGAVFGVNAKLAKSSGGTRFEDSPFLYNVGWQDDGGIGPVADRSFRTADLVEVATVMRGSTGRGSIDGMVGGALPLRTTQYFSPGIPQDSLSFVSDLDGYPSTFLVPLEPAVYTQDGPKTRELNKGPFGPGFPKTDGTWGVRYGDDLVVSLPMFTGSDPKVLVDSEADTALTTISRDGVELGREEFPGFVVGTDPGGSGQYALHAEATRPTKSDLSTSVSADWTFRSASVPGDQSAVLPLLAVAFQPQLDERNSAQSGRLAVVPLHVERNGEGKVTSGFRTPTVQVSYDDGQHWLPALVVRTGDKYQALVVHPRGPGFVSLRAQTSDNHGSSVNQTVIRAYALR